jgi:A/G-specific adenine glycosylase
MPAVRKTWTLRALPGIGRSTAGAILALSRGQRHPIPTATSNACSRGYHGVGAGPARRRSSKRLWTLAEAHTPANDVARYTQAMMDLGATGMYTRVPVCALSARDRLSCARARPSERGCRRRAPQADSVRRTRMLIAVNDEGARCCSARAPRRRVGRTVELSGAARRRSTQDWLQTSPRLRRRCAARVAGVAPHLHALSPRHRAVTCARSPRRRA